MKRKLSNKHKSLLTTSASLLIATSVVAPLSSMTSCSNNSQFESYIDHEFGITEQTYEDLKDQFSTQYKAQLELEVPDEDKREELLNDLGKHFNSFDKNKLEKKCGYTTLTSALINFSKTSSDARGKKYKVKLTRKSNATWAQVDGIFNSWKGSFKQYMLNSDMPASTITRVMQDAQNRFVVLKKELQQTCNDATDGLIQAKSKLITCFEQVNNEISLVSSTVQLKEFLSQYTFAQKNVEDEDYNASCLDRLLEDTKDGLCDFKEGNILCDTTMNRVLNIFRKDDGKKVAFSSTMVKGYTLLPILTKITINKLSNVHTFAIDFGLVKTSYIGKYSKEALENLTAHNYSLNQNNWELNDINSETTLDQAIKKLTPVPIIFPIYFTKETEREALLESYFTKDPEKSYLSFEWDNNNPKNQARESFYDNTKAVSSGVWESKSELTVNSLINSGIIIVDHNGNKTTKKFVKDAKKEISSNVDDNGIDTHVNTLDQIFLSFCDFCGKVSITETKEHNTVNFTNFYAWYNNSPYKNLENGKVELHNNDPTYTVFQTQCIDHEISDNFFMKINQKFNNVINHISLYDGKVLQGFKNPSANGDVEEEEAEAQRLYKTAEEQYIATMISTIGGSVATSVVMGYAYFSSSKSGPGSNKTDIVTILLLIAFVITQIVIAHTAKDKFDDIKNKAEKAKKFKEEYSQSSPLVAKLTTDSQNFVYINEDGSYDKQAFKKAKSKFEKLGMTTMLNLYRMYASPSNIKNDEGTISLWDEYKSKADEEGIGSDDYKITLDDFLKVGGHYWIISWACTITSLLISIGLAIWIKKDRIRNKLHNIIDRHDDELEPSPAERSVHEAMTFNDERVESRVDKFSKGIEECFLKAATQDEAGLTGYLPDVVVEGPAALTGSKWVMNCIMNVWAITMDEWSKDIWGTETIDDDELDARTSKLRDLINKKNSGAYEDGRPWDVGKIIELFMPKEPV